MNLKLIFIFLLLLNFILILFSIYLLKKSIKNIEIIETNNLEKSNIEKEIKSNMLEFSDTNVKEIMTARTSIYALEKDEILENVIEEIIEKGFSRIPVYEVSIDNIVGILYIKDILKVDNSKTIEKYMKEAFYIPETKSISKLLEEFRLNHKHIAIIINEYGGTSGLVSIEDILEEIVGEIRDEYDEEVDDIVKISENIYEIQGDKLVEEVDEELNIKIPISDEYDTISGYVQYASGKVPEINDIISTENYVIKILELENKRIMKVKLVLLNTGGSENE